jgi:hypothetical protein
MASPFSTSSQLSAARRAGFSVCVSSSVSNDYKREVNAAPRSKIFWEPISRKRRVSDQALGVVDILIPRQAAVYRLSHEVGHR